MGLWVSLISEVGEGREGGWIDDRGGLDAGEEGSEILDRGEAAISRRGGIDRKS